MLVSSTLVAPNRWRQSVRRLAVAMLPKASLVAARPALRDAVCLTFDDGPDPVGTPRVLDQLRAAGVRATFFLVGRNVEAYPHLVGRIRDEGHEIGHHSWSHGKPNEVSAGTLADEARRTRRLLHATTGAWPRLFRPPHGALTVAKLLRLWAMRQTVVLWSYDPGDGFRPSAADFLDWTRAHPPRGGDILLLHDAAPVLASGLPDLIDDLGRRGFRFVTVSELVAGGPPAAREVTG